MNTILINTSAYLNEVYIWDENKNIISFISKLSNFDEYETTTNFLRNIDFKILNNIEKIICINGPGSFTGIRIGATISNAISFIKNIPIYSLNAFEYIYQITGYFTLIDAGKDEFYSCNIEGNFCDDIKIIHLDNINQMYKNIPCIVFAKDTVKQKLKIPTIDYFSIKKDFAKLKLKSEPQNFVQPLYIKNASITIPKCGFL